MGDKNYLEYQLACTEILEVIKNMPKKESSKIPQSVIKNLKSSKRYDYRFHYDHNKKANEQNLSKKAKEMLDELYKNYILPDQIRKLMMSKEKFDKKKSNT